MYWTDYMNEALRSHADAGPCHYSVRQVQGGRWIAVVSRSGGPEQSITPTNGWRTREEAKEACETHAAGLSGGIVPSVNPQ